MKAKAKAKSKVGGYRKGAGRPKGSKTRPRTVATYAQLGDAPTDELEVAAWAYRANAVALREVMLAPMAPEKRRAEIRTISRALNAMFPKARLRKAELLILGQADAAAAPVAPNLEAAPARAPRLRAVPAGGGPPQPEPVPRKEGK